MLPDYPEFKKECEKIVREKLDQVRDDCVAPFGPKSEAANHFEGRMFEIIRADGSGEPETYSQVEEKFFFKNGELEKLTLEQLLDKYSEVGESMGRQQFGIMMNAINNAIQGGPNEIIASQEDLIEQIFTSLETIHLDFDDDGQPSKLQIIAAPGMAKRLREASEEIENTPKLKKRHEELLNKKREEFRDREATRKLVD